MSGGPSAERPGWAEGVAVSGRRIGPFLLLVDCDGMRHAVRLGSVMALSDGDEAQDTTVVQFPGGRSLRILAPLEEVLDWLD